ncbi:interferon-induced protein with tetratricopeptide repeats 5-like isoform X1 [Harpia harpyja]|uniref:interferon-induced protein with tetratricopeptide repeats 5-like isoform X1 n=1 Tax=Harpia harpyja TaxID=202280 RepID=UPI0022B0CD1F|nr:interferon-induced protein with tetratricopeptide repeats 5-like isoform X1 [Harpia harpyja]
MASHSFGLFEVLLTSHTSTISKNSLKSSLLQLECHFTWTLLKQDVDLDDLEETIGDQIEFFIKSNITNYNLLSYVCHLKNSNEEALRNLQKAEEEVKKNHPDEIARRSLVTWGNYAWIYYHMERYEEAQTYVSKVENSCKKLSSTAQQKIQLPEIYAEQGWALLKFGRKYYKRAKNCFENALKNEPNNPEFNAGYAIAMYRLEDLSYRLCQDLGPSLEPLKRAVELNPKDTFIMALLALKLQDLERVDEGERYIEEAMQKTPDLPYFLRYAAKFYRRKGELDKALKILKKALAVTPKSTFLHHQLGLCYRAKLFQLKKTTRYPPQEQVEELIRLSLFHFKTVTGQKTKFFTAHTDLANMYAQAKRYEEAEETFQKAFQINILSCVDKQYFYYNYGNFQRFHMKSESEAIKYYIEGLKIEEDSYVRKQCEYALKKLLEQRIQEGLGDATDFATLGLVHNLNGETREAIKCYEKAIALCPDNEEYLSALCELRLSISS